MYVCVCVVCVCVGGGGLVTVMGRGEGCCGDFTCYYYMHLVQKAESST